MNNEVKKKHVELKVNQLGKVTRSKHWNYPMGIFNDSKDLNKFYMHKIAKMEGSIHD